MKRKLSVPEQHQLKVARRTLEMSDVGARIMGPPTKAEAREIIKRLTGRAAKENPTSKSKRGGVTMARRKSRKMHTGKRGGRYYISKGRKVYPGRRRSRR